MKVAEFLEYANDGNLNVRIVRRDMGIIVHEASVNRILYKGDSLYNDEVVESFEFVNGYLHINI